MKPTLIIGLVVVGGTLAAQDGAVLDGERLARIASFKTAAPSGLPGEIPAPMPMTRQAWDLGRRLFSDPILSSDRTVSCASCHVPDLAFSSREQRPAGIVGKRALRHPPALINRAWGKAFSWDGRAATLEEQVLLPIENDNEMALPLDDAIARLRADSDYAQRFLDAFESDADRQGLADALATFVRSLTFADSPFDQFRQGLIDTLTRPERTGMWIFESKGGCWQCHTEPFFTDEAFHNTGIGVTEGRPEEGRMAITGDPEDRGRFKTPTLRGLTFSAPYMHDGSLATLAEVIAFYRRGGGANENLDPRIKPLDITDSEAANLVAFLRALSRQAPDR